MELGRRKKGCGDAKIYEIWGLEMIQIRGFVVGTRFRRSYNNDNETCQKNVTKGL